MKNMMKVKEMAQNVALKSRYAVTVAALSCAAALPALAAEEGASTTDVTTVLTSSFQDCADTMLKTIFATLPVVMSVMSAYLCIRFGINFFKKFSH
jgi:hypothetical protein